MKKKRTKDFILVKMWHLKWKWMDQSSTILTIYPQDLNNMHVKNCVIIGG